MTVIFEELQLSINYGTTWDFAGVDLLRHDLRYYNCRLITALFGIL